MAKIWQKAEEKRTSGADRQRQYRARRIATELAMQMARGDHDDDDDDEARQQPTQASR